MSINLEDLWIGDHVRSLSSGATGRFEGEDSPGIARVLVQGKIRLIPASDLAVTKPPETKLSELPHEDSVAPSLEDMVRFDRTIDLHIEHLNPTLQHSLPATILRYQLTRCRSFLESAVRHRAHDVKIIHGKGKGVLRSEVEMMLRDHPAVVHYVPGSDSGAFDVVLQV